MHFPYDSMVELYKLHLLYFWKKESGDKFDLAKFDPDFFAYHVMLIQLYLGAVIHGLLLTPEYFHREEMTEDCRKRCRDFCIHMAHQVRKRFDFNNETVFCLLFKPKIAFRQKQQEYFTNFG